MCNLCFVIRYIFEKEKKNRKKKQHKNKTVHYYINGYDGVMDFAAGFFRRVLKWREKLFE